MNLDRIAKHESGHAVVAVRLGGEVEHARVGTEFATAEPRVEGQPVVNGYVLASLSDHDLIGNIAIDLGGLAADLAAEHPTPLASSAGDMQNIARRIMAHILAGKMSEAEIPAIIDEAFSQAAEIIEWNRDKIEDLADELLEKRRLSGEDIKRILRPHTGQGDDVMGIKFLRDHDGHRRGHVAFYPPADAKRLIAAGVAVACDSRQKSAAKTTTGSWTPAQLRRLPANWREAILHCQRATR